MNVLKRIPALLLALTILLTAAACSTADTNDASSTKSERKSMSVIPNKDGKAVSFKYYSTDIWQQVPFVSQKILDLGYKGGEGCQWMTFIAFDQSEGKTAYACVDVGGILKSTDGGKSWNQSAIGLESFGSTGVTVDPTNTDRVLVVGGNGSPHDKNGIYLSTDEGVSWSPKCYLKVAGGRDFRRQIAYDESSFDKKAGYCKVAYWSTENIADIKKGIYRTADGGETWSFIENSADYAGSCIAVHPKNGDVYVSNSKGLFRSTDGGKSWMNTGITEKCYYMAAIRTQPDKIYLTGEQHFMIYDCKTGKTDDSVTVGDDSEYPKSAHFLSVSPADPNRMVLQADSMSLDPNSSYEYMVNFFTTDGGKTWERAKSDFSGSFIPANNRQNPSSFHPKDPNKLLKLGGDFIMRSDDGGKTYKMSNDGNNAMYIGGMYNFNVNDSNIIAFASQDYNGAVTTDGGKTWTYINWSGAGWGGFTYGSYALDKKTYVVGLSDEWYNGKVEIVVTHDGGKTIEHTGIVTTSTTIGCGALGNDKVAFYADYRTDDGGYTWKKMNGCTAVYCIDHKQGRLFGVNGTDVVMSSDNGVIWEKLTTIGSAPYDMAFNYDTEELFISGSQLYVYKLSTGKRTMADTNLNGFNSIAIDPGCSEIMYGVRKNWSAASNDGVFRSLDGGRTWHTLNINPGDGREGTPDGGRVAEFLRVNGRGEVWVTTNCRGTWKMVRPDIKKK